jgi:hypothetical protein
MRVALLTAIALLSFIATTVVACNDAQRSPSQSAEPNRVPLALPSPRGEQVRIPQPDGSVKLEPASARVVAGVTYTYLAFTHCGFTKETFDFDDSFWRPVGVGEGGQGNPPPGIGNPEDQGTIVLSAPDRAIFTSASGILVPLDRVIGPVTVFGCD